MYKRELLAQRRRGRGKWRNERDTLSEVRVTLCSMRAGKCKALCVKECEVRERKSRAGRTTERRRTVVPPDKGVTVLVGLLAVYVFLCLFEGNVHVAVEATENACGRGG